MMDFLHAPVDAAFYGDMAHMASIFYAGPVVLFITVKWFRFWGDLIYKAFNSPTKEDESARAALREKRLANGWRKGRMGLLVPPPPTRQ